MIQAERMRGREGEREREKNTREKKFVQQIEREREMVSNQTVLQQEIRTNKIRIFANIKGLL